MRNHRTSTPTGLARASGKLFLAACAAVLMLALVLVPGYQGAQAGGLPGAIYLDGANGNDANDGSSAALAVKTFDRARALAASNLDIVTIYVTGTVPVSGEVSLAGTSAVLKREASFTTGNLLSIPTGGTATLRDITIDGNSEEALNTSKSLIANSGTLNIEAGAVLQNNKIGFPTLTDATTGGAVYSSGGTVNMTGGVIQNNTATRGGGIMLISGATLNMSGGVIRDNQAINGIITDPSRRNNGAAGGGVALYGGATFNLSAGLIQNNSSTEIGGGISVGTTETTTSGDNKLVMTGGKIDQNTSEGTGGGIFIQAAYRSLVSSATITAGEITNNHMLGTAGSAFAFGGGGIYVNGIRWENYKNGQLFLENVVVTDNEAALQGGGYASCPISYTKINLTDGAAIYGNEASSAEDLYIYSDTRFDIWLAHAGNPEFEISSTMLGGVPYRWLYPDGSEVPLSQLSGVLTGDGVGFGMHTEASGNANTQALAKVFITGNTSATRGGGIGSNGDVIIGKKDELTQISMSKTWDDDADFLKLRPEAVEVEVWRKVKDSQDEPTYVGFDRVLPDALTGEWALTISLLPARDEAGNLYEYSIRERPVDNYTTAITGDAPHGYILTNSLIPELIRFSGSKTWNDNNNQDGKRPGSITIRLLQNGTEIRVVTVTAAEGWAWEFIELPKYDRGQAITYSITEDAVGDYSSQVQGFDVVNAYTPGKTSVQVTKVWDDANNQDGVRPGSIVVKLLADGFDTGQTLTLTAVGSWTGTFTGLDEYKDGKRIAYSVQETPVGNGYIAAVSGDASQGFILTNSRRPEKISVSGSKTWDDNNNQDGKRPEEITIHLLKNGMEIASRAVTAAAGWAWEFAELPKYEGGHLVTYTITEDVVAGYSTQVQGFDVTNVDTPGKTSVQVTKAWDDANNQDGLRPDSILVKLLADGLDTGQTLTLTAQGNWTGTFTGLDEYKDGKRIAYSVQESPVGNGYTTAITGDASHGYILTNSRRPEKISISGSKTWDDQDDNYGLRPQKITVNLYANAVLQADKSQTVRPDADGNWSWSWENLDLYQNGKELHYEIGEMRVPDYTAEFPDYSSTPLDAYNITNRYLPDAFNIPVRKFWNDQDNLEGLRPQSIEVRLYANGEDTGKTVTLNGANHWKAVFLNLDKYDRDGNAISYRLEEISPSGMYTAAYRPAEEMTVEQLNHVDARSGATILNSRAPETLTVVGSKTWEDNNTQAGKRPGEITIRLLKNGTEIESKTVTAVENWAWQFNDLPKYEDGQAISYTITEDAVAGYSAQVQGFDVTNAYQPPDPPDRSYPVLLVPLTANKVLKNGSLQGGEFSFELRDKQGKVIAEAKNAADGTVTFPERSFSREVTNWVYTIHEVAGQDPKIIYDSTVYTVRVTTRAVNGLLEATVTIDKNDTPYAGPMTFVNQREMPPTGDRTPRLLGIMIASSLLMMAGAYRLRAKRKDKAGTE